MSADTPTPRGFRRQVVFRLALDDWPLMEQAIAAHGSIQAAVLAGLRALGEPAADGPQEEASPAGDPRTSERKSGKPASKKSPDEPDKKLGDGGAQEIPAREAAGLLGLKAGTVRGYIRSGRLPGRYDGEPGWRGWLTTRDAVEAYRQRRP